jgi:outer membrane protein assembly factor BamB
MSLKGNLSSVNLTEIFQMLSLSGREGTLFIYEGARKRAICFTKEGVSIRSRERNETNLVGKILVRLGKVDERDLQAILDARRSGNSLVGDELVEQALCVAEDVNLALRIQSEEEIQDLFLNRSDAQFEYVDGYFPETDAPFVNLNVNSLLIEIARRTDEWEYIRRRIRGPREIYRFTGVEGSVDADVLAECYAHRVDSLIDGTHSVGEIIEHSYVNKFEVCKLLAAYLDAGVIEQVPADAVRQNARLALRMGDTEGAIRHYEYLMTTGDFPLDVMAEAAEAHEANRDFSESAALLRRLAEELVRSGDYRGAIDALRSVATYPRPEPEALRYLMDLVFENPRAAAEFSGNIVEAGKTLVAYYMNHDQQPDALALLERLLQTFPDEVTFAVSLVNVYYEEGNLDSAAMECERLANAFYKRKRPSHAVSLYKKLLVIDPERTDIRERIRKIVSGRKRRTMPVALPRVAIALAVSLLVGGAAVVVLKREGMESRHGGGLDNGTMEKLFGRGVDAKTNAAEHGRRAEREFRRLLAELSEDPLANRESIVARMRVAEQQYQLFEEQAEKVFSIADTIRRQTADREASARARAMKEGITAQQGVVQAARGQWRTTAQEMAEVLRSRGRESWKQGRHLSALDHFVLSRQLAMDHEWRMSVGLDKDIETIRSDVETVDRKKKIARAHEDEKNWTTARRHYLELLSEYRDSDLVKDVRLPVEVLTVPPGAKIRLDGVEHSQSTPTILRLSPFAATTVELTKSSFEPRSLTLGPFGASTNPARYQYTRDLRKTASWKRMIRGHIEADPVAWDGRVAVVERNGQLFLFDARNGKQIASDELDTFNGVTAGLAGDSDTLFIASLDGKVFAYSAMSGNRRYTIKPKESSPGIYARPVVADGVLYTVDHSGAVSARDLESRKLIWRKQAEGGVVRASPTVQGEDLVVVSVSGEVTVFKNRSGNVVIRYRLQGTFLCAPATAGPDDLVFATEEGVLYGVARLTGAVSWTHPLEASFTRTPPVRGRAVFVSPQPGQLIAIDRATGDEIYRYVRSSAAARTRVMRTNRVFFADGQTLSAFAPRADGYGLAWTFQAQARILAGPVVHAGAVYIADEKGYLYRLEAND